jgi:signal transduction histidine kinase
MNEDQSSPEKSNSKGEQHFRNVEWRIMMRQLPLLMILFACLLFWLEGHLKDAFHSTNADLVRQSGLMVVTAVQSSMASQDTHRIWERLEENVSPDGNVRLTIVNAQGKVLHATDRNLLGHVYQLTDPTCVSCHVGGSREAVAGSRFSEGAQDGQMNVFAAPLNNTEQCRDCHADDGVKLGMVYVEQSLQPMAALVRTTRIGLIVAGVLAYLLTFLSNRLVLQRYLNRPLRRLMAGARALGSGDLEVNIQLPERTELSVLGDTFNHSAKQLREGIQKITDQRDDLQTLYFIADQLNQQIRPEERRRRAVEIVHSIFKSDCLIITGHTHPETQEFHGMLTYRDSDPEIREMPLRENQADPEISFFSPGLFKRWLRGELDGRFRIREAGIVAYPLERHGRRLGLTMAPARRRSETPDGRATAASPKVVDAFIKHLAIALELTELQREHGRQERLAAVGETVAGLSHCMKNTLNGLRGGLYVVQRATETGNEERLEQGWKVLINSVSQIERLSLDMLYFVGERKPQLEPVNPNQILSEIVDLLAEPASHHGVSIQADLDEGIGPIMLDRLALYRAVLNLVTNAIDACYESETGDLVIVRSQVTEEELVISIQDNGVGMSEITRQRLFQRYFSTKAARGTGLGLPVVRKIMDELGGHVVVESTLGKGSTFHIHLPRKPAEE